MENEILRKLESMNCEIEDIKNIVNLMNEDCFIFNDSEYDNYEIRDKFKTAQIMTNAILKLLYYIVENSNKFIDKVYKDKKEGSA